MAKANRLQAPAKAAREAHCQDCHNCKPRNVATGDPDFWNLCVAPRPWVNLGTGRELGSHRGMEGGRWVARSPGPLEEPDSSLGHVGRWSRTVDAKQWDEISTPWQPSLQGPTVVSCWTTLVARPSVHLILATRNDLDSWARPRRQDRT